MPKLKNRASVTELHCSPQHLTYCIGSPPWLSMRLHMHDDSYSPRGQHLQAPLYGTGGYIQQLRHVCRHMCMHAASKWVRGSAPSDATGQLLAHDVCHTGNPPGGESSCQHLLNSRTLLR